MESKDRDYLSEKQVQFKMSQIEGICIKDYILQKSNIPY